MTTLLALSQPNLNSLGVLMTLVAFVVVFVLGPRFFKSEVAKAREGEMKRTIDAYKGRVEALEKTELANRAKIDELQVEVRDCHAAAARWEARYNEVSQYSAPEAVRHFQDMLEQHSARVAKRHEMLLTQGTELAQTQARIAETLDKLTDKIIGSTSQP